MPSLGSKRARLVLVIGAQLGPHTQTHKRWGCALTFQNRVHGAAVQGAPHVHEEQLLRPGGALGQIEDDQLLMGGQRLHHLVQWLPFDFGAHDVHLCRQMNQQISTCTIIDQHPSKTAEKNACTHLRSVCVGHAQEAYPIAVAHTETGRNGHLIV